MKKVWGYEKYLLQFLFEHPHLKDISNTNIRSVMVCKKLFYFDKIKNELKENQFICCKILSDKKLHQATLNLIKSIGQNNQLVSIKSLSDFCNKMNELHKIFKTYRINHTHLFKIMYDQSKQYTIGVIGFLTDSDEWFFKYLDLDLLIFVSDLYFRFILNDRLKQEVI